MTGQDVRNAFEAAALSTCVRSSFCSEMSISDYLKSLTHFSPLQVMKDMSPSSDILHHFPFIIISGKKREHVNYLCYDIMYAVTNGQWVKSKQVLLPVALSSDK